MTGQPMRTTAENTLTSDSRPAIELHVADDFSYVGTLQIIIHKIAAAEVFAFVRADSAKHVNCLFIVQFEGFLPDNTHTYNYPVRHTVTLGDHEYVHDTFVYALAPSLAEPESDSGQTLSFLISQGYTLPEEVVSCRFIRALDGTCRNEILFSYAEDLSSRGLTAAAISEAYIPTAAYAYLGDEMLERARGVFTILRG